MGSNLVARPYGLSALRTAIQSCSPSLRARPRRPLLQAPIRQRSDDYRSACGDLSDDRSSPEVIHGELTDLLDEFGLADIPSDTAEGHGVRITIHGELRVLDRLESRKRHATALALWPSMTSLSTRDFLALSDRGKHLRGWRSLSADKVIPIRSKGDLRYVQGWILLFRSPAYAHAFQVRAHQLRALARRVTPDSPTSGVRPPPGYDVNAPPGFTIRDYALTSLWQFPALKAFLHPFPRWMDEAIELHHNLISISPGSRQGYPVRIWIDEQHMIPLDEDILKQLISVDGHNRGTWWPILRTPDAYRRLTSRLPHGLMEDDKELRKAVGPKPRDSWRVLFATASDARRFVRVWHRRRLPDHLALNVGNMPEPVIKAECLFPDHDG